MSINKVFYILLIVASTVTLGSCGSSKEVVYFPGFETRGNRNQVA